MEYNHALSVVHPDTVLGKDVTISPFVTIEEDVVIGEGTWIGPHVSIMSGTRIGKNCRIFPGAIIGAVPQDLKYRGEYATVEIGDQVTIREYCTLNKGTEASDKTVIGDRSLLMAYVHVAHDCQVGKNVILANNVNLAGHIVVEDFAVLGGLTAVHQFVKIGTHAMVGGGSLVRKDVPPYVKAAREPLSFAGVNSIGLRRRGFTNEQVHAIQEIYRILFVRGYNTSQALTLIESTIPASIERDNILQFIQNADRGIMRGFRQINGVKAHGDIA
ncbi:MAG: acyl-ACP--UDP-N-acetylglucosamine O-acyltransferase [Lewinellaceae bacterium]|nr:acyl-ACP--UDP-N-acetylglucosamine O-acyltransferase [Lewinellaceae bacterium]HRW75712.1 acyl-ACP--UDP-N-acetylglucosamine O-acyltransferase [Saprospiraceae bacterium]